MTPLGAYQISAPGRPVSTMLLRHGTGVDGDLEGGHRRAITLGLDTIWTNPFAPARLSDGEIAIAACLESMNRYVRGGPTFYGLADAAEDQYISELIDQAARTRQPVNSTPQPWTNQPSSLT